MRRSLRSPTTTGFAPAAVSSSAIAPAIAWVTTSFGSSVAAPASIATACPSIEARMCRSSSSSRTMARDGAESCRAHALEHGQRVQAGDPVGYLTDVALELAEGPVAVGPEQAVLTARIEPERVQLALQRADIVAAEHRGVQVQGAVAQAVARFHQLAPGVGPHDAVHTEQPILLERRARPGRSRARNARRARRRRSRGRARRVVPGCRRPRVRRLRVGRCARVSVCAADRRAANELRAQARARSGATGLALKQRSGSAT